MLAFFPCSSCSLFVWHCHYIIKLLVFSSETNSTACMGSLHIIVFTKTWINAGVYVGKLCTGVTGVTF